MGKLKDLSGQKFGRLTAISLLDKKETSKLRFWLCKCDCGNEIEVSAPNLINYNTKSCGCLRKETIVKTKIATVDYTGRRKGMLVAVEPTSNRYNRSIVWKFKCDCGNVVECRPSNIFSGNKNDCGCSTQLNKNSISGVKGVCFNKRSNKYCSYIYLNGKRIHLGYFNTIEEAKRVKHIAEIEIFGKIKQ